MGLPFALVHFDDALVVVDKPSGLLSVPGRGPGKADCLTARVQSRFPEARVVHRLDMATSGLLVLVRDPCSQRRLSAAFAARQVIKTYVAIVHGLPEDDAGEIDLPLAADWPRRPRQRVDQEGGKPALTRWRVLARDAQATQARVELQPVTGRSHQLRVHLAAIGHAIVGDALYGPDADAASPSSRLRLHASRLVFDHPVQGAPMCFDSPVPF